jgi:hypothetical protein
MRNSENEEEPRYFVELQEIDLDVPRSVVEWLNRAEGIERETIQDMIARGLATKELLDLPPNFNTLSPEAIETTFRVRRLHNWRALFLLRRCKQCNRNWFVALHSNYQFCSDECRERFYRHSEAASERARLRMRAYRERLKKRQSAELKIAKSKHKP